MQWIPFAMVRISAFFIAGILVCVYSPVFRTETQATIFLIVLTGVYFISRFYLTQSRSLKTWTGVIGLTTIFVAGYVNVLLRTESTRDDHLQKISDRIVAYQLKLLTSNEEKEKSFKRTGVVQAVLTEKGWRPGYARVNLYWPKQEPVSNLDYGDILLIKGGPREIDGPSNPHEFDLKRYLHFKNIYHQQYLTHGAWTILRQSTDRGPLFYAHRARTWSVAAIKKSIPSPREQAIVIALVLGVTDGLDSDLLNAYATSGAMHVLAVSGLHVSIIYGILLFLFRPLGRSHTSQWIIAVVSLVLLWGYAFITGLSPSVLRAVAMFSFVAISKPVGRSTNIYNTLAASAFCLLLYDPFLIMSLGFQLSYLAVLGIVYLQRPLYNLWESKSALLDWVWQVISVSLAAQLSTFGLGLLYFHQFPVYFLPANLFVIPASFVILVAGIVLLLVSPLAIVASWLGLALEWFVKIVNEGVFIVERLPFSLINHIYINGFQCFLLFLLVLGGILLIKSRKFKYAGMMAVCTILFSFSSWHHFHNEIQQSRWIVYKVPGHSTMEWTEGGHSLFLADSTLLKDDQKVHYHIEPNRLALGVEEITTVSILKSVRGIQFLKYKGKTFARISDNSFSLPEHLSVDYLVVSNNSVKSLYSLEGHLSWHQVIFDSSNSFRYCERMEGEAKAINKSYHSVLNNGAYVLNL